MSIDHSGGLATQAQHMTVRVGLGLLSLALLVVPACNSGADNASTRGPTTSASVPPSSATAATSPLVGEWQRLQKCAELEQVMRKAGLHDALLESIAADGWIPGVTKVSEIKDPAHPCAGAVDRTHSHFFAANGQFGSRDANGQQVDDGQYRLVGDAFVIDSVTFHYTITGNDTLSITPETPDCAPSCFEAGWSIAVAYPGYTWHRIS
jgi:hypothetical protein